MRKMLSARAAGVVAAGLMAAGGAAATAGAAKAQPTGYYPAPGAYAYRYDPPRAYDANGDYTGQTYGDGYDGYDAYGDAAAAAGDTGAALGAAVAAATLGHAPYDQYGPDPNGAVAPDGHQLKCKLVQDWNDYADRYVTRRVCW